MEKLPLGQRPPPHIVGRGSKEAKEKAVEDILYRFGEGHFDQLSGKNKEELEKEEREKSEEELEMIRVANDATNEVLRSFGLPEFDIPARNVHFIPRERWTKTREQDADTSSMATVPKRQAIVANGDSKLPRAAKATGMFHEFLHLKGQLSIEVDSDKSKDLYRSGLIVGATYKKTEKSGLAMWFDGLNEAVVTEMEMKHAGLVLSRNDFLKKDVEWLSSPVANELKKKAAENNGIEVREIRWVDRDGVNFVRYGYPQQRRVFNYVVDEIFSEGGFGSRDEVTDIFFKAHFTKNLLSLGRLVEETFGNGSFRLLGTMERKGDFSIGRVLDELMRSRRRVKKSIPKNQ